jgi:hypothetical protein
MDVAGRMLGTPSRVSLRIKKSIKTDDEFEAATLEDMKLEALREGVLAQAPPRAKSRELPEVWGIATQTVVEFSRQWDRVRATSEDTSGIQQKRHVAYLKAQRDETREFNACNKFGVPMEISPGPWKLTRMTSSSSATMSTLKTLPKGPLSFSMGIVAELGTEIAPLAIMNLAAPAVVQERYP